MNQNKITSFGLIQYFQQAHDNFLVIVKKHRKKQNFINIARSYKKKSLASYCINLVLGNINLFIKFL